MQYDVVRKPQPVTSEESITRPEDFVGYILNKKGIVLPEVPRTCIISHSQGVLDMACDSFPCHVVDLGARRPVEVHFFGDSNQPLFAVVACPLGAPMASVLIEELIVLGFEQFVAVGIAGHPSGPEGPKMVPGDLVLVDEALIYEGTSSHYFPGSEVSVPDSGLTGQLDAILKKNAFDFHRGRAATTDAFYRETGSFLEELLERDVAVIDMELSAMFTVCAFHGKKLAALVYISDVVQSGEGQWEMAFIEERINRTEEDVFRVLLDFIGLP